MTVKLIIQNLLHKPLSLLLSVLLLMLGTGIISFLIIVQGQMEKKLRADLKDIDLVVGAKGSPLQLVLSSVYHLDAPVGNISKSEAEKLKSHFLIEQIIPLALGDSYQNFRIVGTTEAYIKKYDPVFSKGRIFKTTFEAVVGANVALKAGLKPGSLINSTHGLAKEGGDQHDTHPYRITGILQPTGSVIDHLILTSVESVWAIHSNLHENDSSNTAEISKNGKEGNGDHPDHGPDRKEQDDHSLVHTDSASHELTSLLIKFRSPLGLISIPGMINENTNMQAVVPALEMNRLFALLGIGADTVALTGKAIMLVSVLSIFITLFSRLSERKYEMALLRSMGIFPLRLFYILLAEGIAIAIVGFAFGIVLSRIGIMILNSYGADDYYLNLNVTQVSVKELFLLLITMALGLAASLIPALRVWFLDVSKTLSDA
ncbi:MAG TPA: ABC transporter permease [Lacibacter sp.]|nr:ABC transporter permease [Lacibacter sp.]HMO87949.1 ABC transporter permease [Lacibacter sp.]